MENTPQELAWHMTGNADEVANILTEFADEIRAGDLAIWKDKSEMHLYLAGKIDLSVKSSNGPNGVADVTIEMRLKS